MPQKKGPAGGRPELQKANPVVIFAWVPAAREAIRSAARIETHAERAGFRRGRGGRWHCGVHADKNPSCSIRGGLIRCWVCNQAWNVIDLEMLATGASFLESLRTLAAEYGLPAGAVSTDPAEAQRAALARLELPAAKRFQRVLINLTDELLDTLKAGLFDPLLPAPEEGEIRSLEVLRQTIMDAADSALVHEYRIWRDRWPATVAALVQVAKCREKAEQRALAEFMARLERIPQKADA